LNPQKPRSFRELLETKFKPTEFVRIVNIDSNPVEWTYLPINKEQHQSTSSGTSQKYVVREEPDRYYMEPGESKVLEGAPAALGVERIFQKVILARDIRKLNITSVWEEYIDKIVIGKEDLLAKANDPGSEKPALTPRDEMMKDLGLTMTEVKKKK
jgi:hypothetical protein